VAGLDPKTQSESPLLLLWLSYFQREGWKRLKRCPQCKKWFVDETKNRMKVHCSEQCKWQWWNREKRSEAGHKHQKKPQNGGKRKEAGHNLPGGKNGHKRLRRKARKIKREG
jgi:hypothetical protein